jgi:hypothetical protein
MGRLRGAAVRFRGLQFPFNGGENGMRETPWIGTRWRCRGVLSSADVQLTLCELGQKNIDVLVDTVR